MAYESIQNLSAVMSLTSPPNTLPPTHFILGAVASLEFLKNS